METVGVRQRWASVSKSPTTVWQRQMQCGNARAGVLRLHRGDVETPAFMPVGTLGAIKGAVEPADLRRLGFDIMLSNTFHLWQRPGVEVVTAHGGLHGFGGWRRPILTDSGGFQVFSLASLRRVSEDGVDFRAPHNGAACFLSPEKCMAIQRQLGSDIVMVLDECAPGDANEKIATAAMRRSLRWAARCKTAFADNPNALFGIVQGGVFSSLRAESAAGLANIGFDGYAIGGLAVGESASARRTVLEDTVHRLPADKPRYLMGVGTPSDIAHAVSCGVDMFDCVLPTRNARNGQLFTSTGVVKIRNSRHRADLSPPDAACGCPVCRRVSRAYLHHLFTIGDMSAARLLTLHNLAYYFGLMRRLRAAVGDGTLPAVVADIFTHYPPATRRPSQRLTQ